MKSDAVRIAQIKAQTELWHDLRIVLTDPLWSSVLGFMLVHEARQADLVGPVADDMLYAGIIAINTTRAGITHELVQGTVGLGQAGADVLKSLMSLGQSAAGTAMAIV